MAAENATGLVVRGTDWSETSRIVTLFTREFGRVRALAKGGRRLNSSFEIALDLLTLCRIVLIRKTSGSLDLLTEAQVAERFFSGRPSLAGLYAGYYVAELLAEGVQDNDPHPALFDEALAALRDLGQPDCVTGPRIAAFELTWLRELGYSPALDECAVCQRPITGRVFSAPAGGVVCEQCAPFQRDRRTLSEAALGMLRELLADSTAWRREWEPRARGEVRSVLGQYVTCRLGRRVRTLAFVAG